MNIPKHIFDKNLEQIREGDAGKLQRQLNGIWADMNASQMRSTVKKLRPKAKKLQDQIEKLTGKRPPTRA